METNPIQNHNLYAYAIIEDVPNTTIGSFYLTINLADLDNYELIFSNQEVPYILFQGELPTDVSKELAIMLGGYFSAIKAFQYLAFLKTNKAMENGGFEVIKHTGTLTVDNKFLKQAIYDKMLKPSPIKHKMLSDYLEASNMYLKDAITSDLSILVLDKNNEKQLRKFIANTQPAIKEGFQTTGNFLLTSLISL